MRSAESVAEMKRNQGLTPIYSYTNDVYGRQLILNQEKLG